MSVPLMYASETIRLWHNLKRDAAIVNGINYGCENVSLSLMSVPNTCMFDSTHWGPACFYYANTALLQSLQIWRAWGHLSVFLLTDHNLCAHPLGPHSILGHIKWSLVNTEWDSCPLSILHLCLHSLLTACLSPRRNPAIDFYHLWWSSARPAVNVRVAFS